MWFLETVVHSNLFAHNPKYTYRIYIVRRLIQALEVSCIRIYIYIYIVTSGEDHIQSCPKASSTLHVMESIGHQQRIY